MEGKFDGIYMNHPEKNTMNGLNNIRVIYNNAKSSGPTEHGMVKTQM